MLLKQIRYYISIVEENSFTEAAEKNYISQSAISQAMLSLEKELGVKLMERGNRSFRLTTAGEFFYRKSKALIAELENIKNETARLGSDREQKVLSVLAGKTDRILY